VNVSKVLTVSFHPPPPTKDGTRLLVKTPPTLLIQFLSQKGAFRIVLISVRFSLLAPWPCLSTHDTVASPVLADKEHGAAFSRVKLLAYGS